MSDEEELVELLIDVKDFLESEPDLVFSPALFKELDVLYKDVDRVLSVLEDVTNESSEKTK